LAEPPAHYWIAHITSAPTSGDACIGTNLVSIREGGDRLTILDIADRLVVFSAPTAADGSISDETYSPALRGQVKIFAAPGNTPRLIEAVNLSTGCRYSLEPMSWAR
jgi:hypothetical protein